MRERFLAALGSIVGVALFAVAIAILHHELAAVHYRDVIGHLHAIPVKGRTLALVLTALGYLSLTGYDTLALRWIRSPIRYGRIAIASFIAYVFSHNVGLSFFGGSAVRYRMFSSWGVTPPDLARVITFNVLTFWLGFLCLGGLALSLDPIRLPAAWHAVLATTRPLGIAFLCLLAVYLLLSLVRRRKLRLRGFEIELPDTRTTLAQVAISVVDWTLAAAVLYVLLPPAHGSRFHAPRRHLPARPGDRARESRARGPRRLRDGDGAVARALVPGRRRARIRRRVSDHLLPDPARLRARALRGLRDPRAPRRDARRRRAARSLGPRAGAARLRDLDVRGRRDPAALGRDTGCARPRADPLAPAAASVARDLASAGQRGGRGPAAARARAATARRRGLRAHARAARRRLAWLRSRRVSIGRRRACWRRWPPRSRPATSTSIGAAR